MSARGLVRAGDGLAPSGFTASHERVPEEHGADHLVDHHRSEEARARALSPSGEVLRDEDGETDGDARLREEPEGDELAVRGGHGAEAHPEERAARERACADESED